MTEKERHKIYYQKNKAKLKAQHKIYWFNYYRKNRDKYRKQGQERRDRIRLEIFNAYGGASCKCCDEKEVAFLSLDHINGGGNQERKLAMGSSRTGGYHFYEWLRKNHYPDKESYQVLCMNCQFGRMHKGVCPHKTKDIPSLATVSS